LTRQTNPPEIWAQENERNAAPMTTNRTNPAYRRQEQIADTNCRKSTRQTKPTEIRAQENEKDASSMTTRHTDPSYRRQENDRNTQALATRCTDPSYRRQENDRNAQVMATSHSNPAYRRQEQIPDTNQRRLAREQPFFYDMATKFNTSSCTYLYPNSHEGVRAYP
jgi:hypothetical protein